MADGIAVELSFVLFARSVRYLRRFAVQAFASSLANFPCCANAGLKLQLSRLDERGVVALGDLYRRVPEKRRNLVDGNSGK